MHAFAVALIALLFSEVQGNAKDLAGNSITDKLLDRAFQADSEHEDEDEDVDCDPDNLDDATLGKPGQLVVTPLSSRTAMLPVGRSTSLPHAQQRSMHPMPQMIRTSSCIGTGSPLVCMATMRSRMGLPEQPVRIRNTPYHLRGKCMSTYLSKDLRTKYGVRNMPLRTNDVVYVMQGDYKGTTGKVIKVNRKQGIVNIEGLKKINSKQEEYLVGMVPSKCMITDLVMDKNREAIIKRRTDGKIHQMRLKSTEENEKIFAKNNQKKIEQSKEPDTNQYKKYQTSGFLAPGPYDEYPS